MQKRLVAIASLSLVGFVACGGDQQVHTSPHIPPRMVWQDRMIQSAALERRSIYRIVFTSPISAGQTVQVLYLLHGNGQSFREWTTASHLAEMLPPGYVLVMPEGSSSYFLNSATKEGDRYEDFITTDLPHEIESHLPTQTVNRAIIGVSMGGFAAITLSLKHPAMYVFAGALSPPIDYAERRFSFRRLAQSLGNAAILGPSDSVNRLSNDPFLLVKAANPKQLPFIFMTVGANEPLRDPVERFNRALLERGVLHDFQVKPGGHTWEQWELELPRLVSDLHEQMRTVSQ